MWRLDPYNAFILNTTISSPTQPDKIIALHKPNLDKPDPNRRYQSRNHEGTKTRKNNKDFVLSGFRYFVIKKIYPNMAMS